MTLHVQHYIGGAFVDGPADIERHNPSETTDMVSCAPEADAAVVDAAVAAAERAAPGWRAATPETRADLLHAVAGWIWSRREPLGRLLAREEGKILAEAIGEVTRAARILRYFAGEALRAPGQALGSVRAGVEVLVTREPVGVAGLIAPWNFPIAIPAWKAAPAIAFGDTVVLKPAPQTPALADALAQAFHACGAPPGLFNLVHGGAAAGAQLAGHPDVAAVSFTGSAAGGGAVAAAATPRGARVQLEMGGKNPLVILVDADLDRAVQIALDGGWFSTGQRCTASSRILVADGVYEPFVARLRERLAALVVGHALDPATGMGPLVSEPQLERSLAFVDEAVRAGARRVFGGERLVCAHPGHYLSPALLEVDDPDLRIVREEVFGPVATVQRVAGLDEAIALANRSPYGLSAGVVTTSLASALRFRREVQAGMVMVNLPTAGVDYHVPFGGVKASSYGPREQGAAAAEFYSRTKTAYVSA